MDRLGDFFARLARRVLPDPMVIACSLTLLVAAAAMLWPGRDELAALNVGARAVRVCRIWFQGVWNPGFLVFALQMCVVLITGYGLAKAPPATKLLASLAALVHSERSAVILVAAVSCVGCWINWGFGLIASGIMATQVRTQLVTKGLRCRYALIVAAAYSGMMIWHGGLSGSAPLRVAREGVQIAVADETSEPSGNLPPIPVTRTILSPQNLVLTAVLIVGVPLLVGSMSKTGAVGDETDQKDAATQADPSEEATSSGYDAGVRASGHVSPADRLNRSRAIPVFIALGFAVVLVSQLWESGTAAIGLNFVNTAFLALGLILHRDLVAYAKAVAEAGRAVTGIVLQFPLYSGIQGIMFGAGLAAAVSQWFVQAAATSAAWLHVSSESTFPIAVFLSAGVVNFFVPSGGGQWIVQGPIMCQAAASLGSPMAQTVLAVSYGDQWTNMIQPFWAIPLMGLTGVSVRHFMGYCSLLMLLAGPVFVVALLTF
ncbi:MAG: short-chain fatty acid transporter [Phycisphaerae bacterium]